LGRKDGKECDRGERWGEKRECAARSFDGTGLVV